VIDPITIAFSVASPYRHAFEMWTAQIGTWWPADHTVSGHPQAVILEGATGGRIFERCADSTEHERGRITAWDPPNGLAYTWHLRRDPVDATDVHVRFVPVADQLTRGEIEHRGWERLGASAGVWRDRNRAGWETLIPHLVHAIDEGDR